MTAVLTGTGNVEEQLEAVIGYTGAMDAFQNLHEACSKLGHLALNSCQSPVPANTDNEESLARILRLREQVADQCLEMKIRIKSDQGNYNIPGILAEENPDITEMTKDLEDVKLSIHNKTLALHRMQFTHAVLEKMKENDKEAQLMKATGKHTLSLCSRIFRLKQESSEIEDQVREVRKRRLALKKEALGKLMEMRAAKKRKEEKMQALQSEMLKKGQGSMEKHLKMVTLVQNVLQGIIIGSRVNWAADPKLKEIALGLEKNPAFD
ncbi:UNVERIFIED_CONTAM: hypothetical protein FKN15_016411 [Acipenser sinensis]